VNIFQKIKEYEITTILSFYFFNFTEIHPEITELKNPKA